MTPRVACVLVTGLAALAACPAAATAGPFPEGASIASASLERLEQGDDTTSFAAVSADARYVVFDTRATNFYPDDDPDPPGATRAGGVFRRDTIGGALVKVADGDVISDEDGVLLRRGAHSPSVSADGRFVAFSTAQQLVPADSNANVDVYRRDMTVAPADPGAYTLVSAKDGGDQPATYAARPVPLPGRDPGTDLFGGRSISADGDRVVLRTVDVASNLPDHAAVDVPGGQLLVREIASKRTRLVTVRTADGQPAGGATGPAVISADGTTVAWSGVNAPGQARFLPGEQQDSLVHYYLYRRLDTATPVTRRITGRADPDDVTCDLSPVGSDPEATGPCYGPLADTEEGRGDISQRVPALSSDGRRVAFLAAAAGRPTNVNNPGLDLFVTDMSPGVSRKAGTRELTREGDPNDVTQSAPIESITMAGDGVHLMIATQRVRFVLPALAPTGPGFRNQSGARELYAIDLRTATIERVIRGVGGADAGGDAGTNPSMSADGATIAFASNAGNLFFGDANERSDAFWVRRGADGQIVAPQQPAPPPAFEPTTEETGPRLSVRVARRTTGALVLTVVAPAAGRISSFARSGAPLRTVARADRAAKPDRGVRLTLKLRGRNLARLRSRGRFKTTIRVRFVPKNTSAKALTRVIKTHFRYKRKKS